MFSVNGVALDNDPLGWIFLGSSEPIATVVRRASGLQVPGVHGLVTVPSTMDAPIIRLDVETPKANLESLYALFNMPALKIALTTSPTREVAVEFMSSRVIGFGAADADVQVEFYVRLNGVFWRDITETTTPSVNITTTPQTVTAFPGISGQIQDAIIKVKGAVTGLVITDSAGSWISYNAALTASQWLRIHTDTGEAFVTATDVWTGGTDVSGGIDTGGAVGGFRITPKMSVAPATRTGELTIVTASRTSAAIQIRGKGAYIV